MKRLNSTIDRRLRREREQRNKRFQWYAPQFYASALGSCWRKAILDRLGASLPAPMTASKIRMFDDRETLHDKRTHAFEDEDHAIAVEHSLSYALGKDWGARLDAIIHECEECGARGEDLRRVWDTMAGLHRAGVEEWTAARDWLARHELSVTDVKTMHPNIIRYTDELPREGNVRQVLGYIYHVFMVYGLTTKGRLYIVPSGGESQDLEYWIYPTWSKGSRIVDAATGQARRIECGLAEIEEEVMGLVDHWRTVTEALGTPKISKNGVPRWPRRMIRQTVTDELLPERLPLNKKIVKAKTEPEKKLSDKVLRVEQSVQCARYCDHVRFCRPHDTVNKKDDRVGVIVDGEEIYVEQWCAKSQYQPPEDAVVRTLREEQRSMV